jgi:hypothetical protein
VPKPPGGLLLLGQGQVFSCVHRPSHPQQGGPLEGGLVDCEVQHPRQTGPVDRCPNGQVLPLGEGSQCVECLRPYGQEDPISGGEGPDINDGVVLFLVPTYRSPLAACSCHLVVHQGEQRHTAGA